MEALTATPPTGAEALPERCEPLGRWTPFGIWGLQGMAMPRGQGSGPRIGAKDWGQRSGPRIGAKDRAKDRAKGPRDQRRVSDPASGRPALGCLAQMGEQKHQCRGRYAFHAGCLGQRSGALALEPLAHFAGKAWQSSVVEIRGNAHALLLAEGHDVGLLPLKIGGVAGVDFELGAHRWRDAQQLRPHGGQTPKIDAGMGQELECRAPTAVPVDVEAVAGRRVRSELEAFEEPAAIF